MQEEVEALPTFSGPLPSCGEGFVVCNPQKAWNNVDSFMVGSGHKYSHVLGMRLLNLNDDDLRQSHNIAFRKLVWWLWLDQVDAALPSPHFLLIDKNSRSGAATQQLFIEWSSVFSRTMQTIEYCTKLHLALLKRSRWWVTSAGNFEAFEIKTDSDLPIQMSWVLVPLGEIFQKFLFTHLGKQIWKRLLTRIRSGLNKWI